MQVAQTGLCRSMRQPGPFKGIGLSGRIFGVGSTPCMCAYVVPLGLVFILGLVCRYMLTH